MRILFTRFPYESARGGAEVQTVSLMEGLKAKGHDVSFLGSCPVLLEKAASCELRAASLNIGLPPVTEWTAFTFYWRQRRMRSLLVAALAARSPKPEALFMLSLSEKILLTDWAHELGIRVFWIEHDRVGRWLTHNPGLPRLRKLSEVATTICVSELSRKIYEDLGFKNVIAIPNGIDLQRFSASQSRSSQLAARSSHLHLGCVARLTEDKGVHVLIQAVADLPQVKLDIVGQGPEEGYLHKLAEEIERITHTIGRISFAPTHPDLGAFYTSLDALVLPSSDHDPFGMVVGEAMALGVAVVVTDACGIAGYLHDGEDAMVCEANSVPALKQGIERVMDPAGRLKIATAGQELATREFSVERMAERYEELLTATASRR